MIKPAWPAPARHRTCYSAERHAHPPGCPGYAFVPCAAIWRSQLPRHAPDHDPIFRAIARTGVDPAAELVADQVADWIAAQAASWELAVALAGLSKAQRDVRLLVASGLGYEEAALALGVPTGTVSSRLPRRRKVRGALGGQDPTRSGGIHRNERDEAARGHVRGGAAA